MDIDKLLQSILEEYSRRVSGNRTLTSIAERAARGAGNYAHAQRYAMGAGNELTQALKKYLPEALTDGKLFRDTAKTLVEKPMKVAGGDVAKVATDVQRGLNEAAGIGLNPITPEMNQDQIDGIITGMAHAESYAAGSETMYARIGNFLEGYVDDFVHDNADFQYKAGLYPTIERKTAGKCCSWCSNLAGSYPYEEVRDRGNDVFRRHKHCHCLVLYNPGDGSKRRQNVHSREWTDEGRSDRIRLSEQPTGPIHSRIPNSELPNGLPLKGTPNSISDKLSDDGKVLQRRKYGADGKAAIDYDTTDHNRPDLHPTGAHKHIFDYSTGEPVRSKKNYPLTREELQLNEDIIIPGGNYHDET